MVRTAVLYGRSLGQHTAVERRIAYCDLGCEKICDGLVTSVVAIASNSVRRTNTDDARRTRGREREGWRPGDRDRGS